MNTIKKYADLVKFSHTIFAMPFALMAFVYALWEDDFGAANSNPYWWITLLVQVVLCMVFARNVAMGFNRWADREIDARNPRTANREIPAGKISPRAALIFVALNALFFIITAVTINPLTAWLSPVALAVVMFYRPVAPAVRSCLSSRRVLRPRMAQSLAVPAPVIPPPMTITSYSFVISETD